MIGKLASLLFVFGCMIAADWRALRQSGRGRERIAYAAVTAFAVYLGLDYVTDAKLPQLEELIEHTVGPAARRMMQMLQSQS